MTTAERFVLSSSPVLKPSTALQVGEVWNEVIQELELEGVRPVSPDAAALEAIWKITEDTATRVVGEQTAILERQEKDELTQEELVYTEVRKNNNIFYKTCS